MNFLLKIDPEALQDIQEVIKWYNIQQPGIGGKFFDQIEAAFNRIRRNPYYQIRYHNVRCLPVSKFPFMIHYTVNDADSIIVIRAVFHTSMDPKHWEDQR